jgi:hypothetical protein
VINNSRVPIVCHYEWAFRRMDSTAMLAGAASSEELRVETGHQTRVPLRVELPGDLPPGEYQWTIKARMQPVGGEDRASDEEIQEDQFRIHVLPAAGSVDADSPLRDASRIALFDPQGETAQVLAELGIGARPVQARDDLAGYQLLVIGRGALSAEAPRRT